MAEERCEKHEMILEQCAYCRPRRKYDWKSMYPGDSEPRDEAQVTDGDEPTRIGPVFPAQHEDTCAGCPAPISEGDPIHYDASLGGYACNACLPETAGAT